MNQFSDIFNRIASTLQAQLTALTSFVIQLQNIGTRAAQAVQQKIQKFMR